MTIDEVEKSVYVGGIPYDTTEGSLRKTFSHYGHVINVKINNEGPGGKCYGFVTFTNPRSAVDAIKDMNGRTIGGRVVRVNEVKVRGGGGNTNREGFRRNFDRSLSDRNRDREYANYEDQHHRTRKRDWYEDRGRDRERGMVRENNHYQARDHSLERDRERSERIGVEEDNRKHEQDRERDGDLGQSLDREVKRITRQLKSGKDDKDQESNQLNGSRFGDRRSREYSSDSRDNDYEVEDELKDANQELEELRKQVSEMKELVDDKQQLVSELQAKSKKLEDALTAAKELSSQRKVQLAKLSRCYLHMKNYNEKLKSSEQELQSLVDTTMVDVDDGAYLECDDVSRY